MVGRGTAPAFLVSPAFLGVAENNPHFNDGDGSIRGLNPHHRIRPRGPGRKRYRWRLLVCLFI